MNITASSEPLVKAGSTTLSSLLSAVEGSMSGNDELNQYAIPYGRTDLRQSVREGGAFG